jgi:hypothetical protein
MLVEIEHLQQLRDRQGYPAVASGPQSAGEVVDKPRWVEEAIYQFLQHLHYLSDRQSGLWYHGWR